MSHTLLAWNFPYPTSQLVGDSFLAGSRRISYLPLSPLSGVDISANPGFDFFALPMPQAGSSKIVFTSNRDGNAQIYSMNADGSGLIRLTTNAYNDDHPRWSPNGTKILFQSDRDNPETGNYDIYVMNANGTSQTRLTYDATDDSVAEWSPDGSKIVFQSLRNGQYYQVYVMNADGTNQVNTSGGFAADYQPSWSPDGSKIAFASERDHAGRTEVYVMNANGSNQTRLTVSSNPFRDEQPAWSRDATKIAFVSTRDSVIETWQETDDDGAILNRSRVRTNKEVYKMNADGSNQIRLTYTLENDDSPYWSPDGTQIIFRSERERDSYDPAQQLWTMNADGTNEAIINSNEFGDYSASWKSTSNQPPVASAGGPYSGSSGSPIQFNGGGSIDPDGPIASYQWNFGDNTSGAGITPTHSYSTAGSYTVTLTVTDNDGATASATATATVANNPPVANPGGPYSGVTAQNIPFSGSGSSDSDGTITSYAWSFGDGSTGSGAVPTHAYTSAGTYTVTLTVSDNQGAQASANTSVTITVAGSEQYLASFNQAALARPPSPEESGYWNDILRSAHANGQNSKLLAMRELGKTLFESSEYAARIDRQGTQHNVDYVYDLYKTYLMREPDGPGWSFWTNNCNSYGRDEVRRAFDESGEFANIVATLTPVGSPSNTVSSLASARIDPFNQPGNGLAARDAQWSMPLLSLPGRAGLDLGLSLSYSSMVWTRSGPYIYFDEDNGWPSPGFRLGFPTIQEKVFDAQAGDNVYLMITGGSRVSLRQVGTSNVYEAADSSYLQLIDNGGSLLLRATDGTQLSYLKFNNEWHSTQIKDRNGNYISVSYDWRGDIQNITDTLGRVIRFVYDASNNPQCLTQGWNGQPASTTCDQSQAHVWATLGWENLTMQPSLSGVVGTYGGESIPVLKMVGFDDGTYTKFLYNGNGQVERVTQYASDSNPQTDNHPRSYTDFDYNSATNDCPRLNATRVWAENWTGINGVPTEVTTQFGVEGDKHTISVVGDPNGTVYKERYGSAGASPAWQRGLTLESEVWSGGVQQKLSTITWTQDNPSVNYKTNPRVTETIISDGANVRKTTIDYSVPAYTQYGLPYIVREYAADGTTILRETYTDYKLDQPYLDQRIIGLVSAVHLVSNGYQSKVTYGYDDPTRLSSQAATATMHDQNFDANFTTRGNVTSVSRWDVTDMNTIVDPAKALTTFMNYNAAGSAMQTTDPAGHSNSISYADSFSDGNNSRNTFAYPTTVTINDPPAAINSFVQYNFDFGAKTRIEGPPPQGQPNGIQQTFAYDAAARLERATTLNSGAYTHYVYGPTYVQTFSSVNTVAANYSASDLYTGQFFDGLGRTYAVSRNHPGSLGGYSAVISIYDRMGRAVQQSNPTEITGAGVPTGDDAYNPQTGEGGWRYTEQSYDWQGRPRFTTNTDGTTKEASYSGCGCAGGQVVVTRDEVGRRQKISYDILGRLRSTQVLFEQPKSEVLNGDGAVYSATVNTYNVRDQVTLARQYAGAEGSATYQDTIMTFDGYGRTKTRHVPEQDGGTATTWDYNADDTIEKVTDARGASATYGYNNHRHLVNTITYSAPTGVVSTPNASFQYDAPGNRTSMMNGSGSVTYRYDQLSRLDWEERTFTGLSGAYRLDYDYNLAGQLTSLVEPTQFGSTFSYAFDSTGRLDAVTGSPYGGVTTYASEPRYRAWGGLKHLEYGDSPKSLDATYNSRLQAASFNIPGVLSKTYDYYDDGSLRFSSDLLNHKMDRFNAFDHAGRIKEAFSGAEARGEPPTNDRPYRQTFGYDPLGHLTTRTSNIWADTLTPPPDTYLNNRRAGWTYDAEGNLLGGADTSYIYDAAGGIATVASFDPVGSTIRGLDGDGKQVRTDETANDEQTQTPTTTTKYYLRSSVLGGQVLTEIDANGAKLRTFVYAGGSVLAWQVQQGTGQRVVWEHRDASGASFRTTDLNGYVWGYSKEEEPAELDPTGANAGLHAPLISPSPTDEGNDSLVPYPSFGAPDPRGTTYIADGMRVSADFFMMLLENRFHGSLGMAEYLGRASSRVVGYRNQGIRWGRSFDITYDTRGRMTSMHEGSSHNPNLMNSSVESPIYASGSFAFSFLPQDSEPLIKVLPGLDSGREKQLRDTLESLKADAKCAAAFANAGLKTIYGMIAEGIVIGPAHLLRNAADAPWVGITERARSDYAKGGVVGSTSIQAVTLKNWPGFIDQTLDSRARIFLNGSAFSGGKYSLREVLVHEFLHVGGWPPIGKFKGMFYETDLSHYDKYDEIIAACK